MSRLGSAGLAICRALGAWLIKRVASCSSWWQVRSALMSRRPIPRLSQRELTLRIQWLALV